jgi:hypothetical protein
MFDRFKLTVARWEQGANMLLAQMLGQGNEDDDTSAERVDDAPFLGQLGLAVYPVVQRTLRGLGWRHGDEVWLLKVWDKARKILDMEEGETRVYAVGGETTRLRLKADGAAVLEADRIKLGAEGTKGVARIDDTTTNGALSFVAAGNALSISYVSPDGTPQFVQLVFAFAAGAIVVSVVPPGSNSVLDLTGRINSGSSKTTAE